MEQRAESHARAHELPGLCRLQKHRWVRGLAGLWLAVAMIAIGAASVPAQQPATSEGAAPEAAPKGPAVGAPRRILALGDSYTIGQGVAPEQRFPELLAVALQKEGVQVGPPTIVARTGWTTEDLQGAIAGAALSAPYDLVTLLIGVNDQFRGYEESKYPARFKGLLQKAIELAGGERAHVIVVSIPDYSVTPFGQSYDPKATRTALDRYNDMNRAVAQELGVARVDITAISRKAAKDESLLADDRLHPSGKMYGEWVERVLPIASSMLRKDGK